MSHTTIASSSNNSGSGGGKMIMTPEHAEEDNHHYHHYKIPKKLEIDQYDLARPFLPSPQDSSILYETCYDPDTSRNWIGLVGPVLDDMLQRLPQKQSSLSAAKKKIPTSGQRVSSEETEQTEAVTILSEGEYETKEEEDEDDEEQQQQQQSERNNNNSNVNETTIIRQGDPQQANNEDKKQATTTTANEQYFDKAEAVVLESLRRQYWDGFLVSAELQRLLNFLWYQDRKVVSEDFYVMRVLGRGGFGLVTACKKGTSGKLYAMKVMNKRRIKMKKSERLALNERNALAAVDCAFVVNLKYSFQSKDDIFLILDLMTGGDLSYHLSQKGRFPKNECVYYAARIMLGLQALHDQGYVYRDLKPENCLLSDDGRIKITDLGLATKITPTLHGAAGTRGYWAPEMLRRDKKGKRMPYGYTVDWFSFGCVLAEFISGTNPFRSEDALNFGLAKGHQTKEKAIDCATVEMDPVFNKKYYDDSSIDLCKKLLIKDERTRLGTRGCRDIMAHPWFAGVNWEMIITDREVPPFTPRKDVNAASQSEIGTFDESKEFLETVLDEKDEEIYSDWDWTNPRAFAREVIEFMIYERKTGAPLIPMQQPTSCCCVIS